MLWQYSLGDIGYKDSLKNMTSKACRTNPLNLAMVRQSA